MVILVEDRGKEDVAKDQKRTENLRRVEVELEDGDVSTMAQVL